MLSNHKEPIKISEQENNSSAFLLKKRKLNLTLNIPPTKEPFKEGYCLLSTPQEICPTPDLEKYIHKEENGLFSPRIDNHGSTFFKFQNSGVTVKFKKNTLVNGAQGKVLPVVAITPNHTRSYALVEKTGGETSKREVKLLQAIKKNGNLDFPFHLIQKILYWKLDEVSTSYYSRHEQGGDLQQHQRYIQAQCTLKNGAALSYVFKVMTQLVAALDALHNGKFTDDVGKSHLGIVHNDLKPANIFVQANGDVVIADFGCAYFADDVASQYATLCFTAPELFLASVAFAQEPLKNADKSDIFSLGLILALLLQGKLPEKMIGNCALPNKFPDGLEAQLNFRAWAEAYETSTQCAKAREAKNYLKDLGRNTSILVDPAAQVEILKNFALVMQLPVAERPSSKDLKDYLCKLAPYFGTCKEREKKSKIFVSALIENREDKTTEATEFENRPKRLR